MKEIKYIEDKMRQFDIWLFRILIVVNRENVEEAKYTGILNENFPEMFKVTNFSL